MQTGKHRLGAHLDDVRGVDAGLEQPRLEGGTQPRDEHLVLLRVAQAFSEVFDRRQCLGVVADELEELADAQ